MKKVLLTIKEDAIHKNNLSEAEVRKLLDTMAHFGTVVEFDAAVASMQREYQGTIDELDKQLQKVEAQKLTADEIAIINSYREQKIVVCAEANERAEKFKSALNSHKAFVARQYDALRATLDVTEEDE